MVGLCLNLLLILIFSVHIITLTSSAVQQCQVEIYNETLYFRHCLDHSISIQTTRCRGQCYSEEELVYDWEQASTYRRYKHNLHCCVPTTTEAHETLVRCQNKQFQTVRYRLVTQCECKPCGDKCFEYV
ncbi:unnamed protein product [Adineta ricciae]|uniref:CTCK domain-containing protein n=1 Tax=Adineta ricciae TaxID=249248 RepID=A0A813XQE0_ADIRI|nr:unnamed protein product [Adineta ricciae]CAF0962835.1 unnamed protein product [Adineta ricciae]